MNKFKRSIEKTKTKILLKKMYKQSGYQALVLLKECLLEVMYDIEKKYQLNAEKLTKQEVGR